MFCLSDNLLCCIALSLDKTSDMESSSDGNDNDKSFTSSGPMSQISGVRRLQQSNSVVGIVPRFGVELADEQPLAQVSLVDFITF